MAEMETAGDTLTPQQAKAIAALLTTRTVEEAAEKCGVPVRSLHRWKGQNEEFREALRIARSEVVSQAIGSLQAAAVQAVETLREIMTNPDAPAHARVSACKIALD